jgi:hypothetical protein
VGAVNHAGILGAAHQAGRAVIINVPGALVAAASVLAVVLCLLIVVI